jgi:hypothetical protein
MEENISELVWLYVKKRPFLKEMLRERIANYSSLARKISREAFGNERHANAVKMALVRMVGRIREREEDLEGRILSVLRGSSLSIRSKVVVIVCSRELEKIKYLSYAESGGMITYVATLQEAEKARRSKSVVRLEPNLNLITVHSPPSLEDTPGVIAHILDALAEEGINVAEFVSCYTDTLLVVREADTARAYEILGSLTADK